LDSLFSADVFKERVELLLLCHSASVEKSTDEFAVDTAR
jgi:hypothetical protein